MALIWLGVLLVYGAVNGWAVVPGLAWWLLLPMGLQDMWDANQKRRH
jgi:hypothetical protein